MIASIDRMFIPKGLSNYSASGAANAPEGVISNLTTINFFVGENNSGKSRLLRKVAANPSPRVRPRSYPKELDELKIDIRKMMSDKGITSWWEEIADLWDNLEYIPGNVDVGQIRSKLFDLMKQYGRQTDQFLRELFDKSISHIQAYIGSENFTTIRNNPPARIYIPVLRGLRPFGNADSNDFYKQRTLADYFEGKFPDGNFTGEIYTGQSFYKDLKSLLLGDHDQRKTAKEFEIFLSEELFGGESVTLIPRENSDVVWLRLGSSPEKAIFNMGDGLQHLIILTFPLFNNRSRSNQVFIEEPELYLHPGMQRSLIKAMRRFNKNQYFIVTHSNHFLDLSLDFDDISIYNLKKIDSVLEYGDSNSIFQINLISSHDFSVLENLGVRASSIFLSNCTVWVEGITDRRYFAHYLRLYIEHLFLVEGDNPVFVPRQDLHYSFVEYSGGNITHWSFLDRIDDSILVERLCAKAMLITDKDKGKDARHKQLKDKMGDRYICLPCREVENLLAPEVLKKILIEYGEDESTIKKFSYEDYSKEYLGIFLNGLIASNLRKRSYTKKEGPALQDKIRFCSIAIDAMPTQENVELSGETGILPFSYGDLSAGSKDLARKMYAFIKSSNGF